MNIDKQITLTKLNELSNLIEEMELIHKELDNTLKQGLLLNDKIIDNDKIDNIKIDNTKTKQVLINEVIPKVMQYN